MNRPTEADVTAIQELIDGTDWLGTGSSQKAADAEQRRVEAAWSRLKPILSAALAVEAGAGDLKASDYILSLLPEKAAPASSAPFDIQRVDDAIYSAIGLISALTSDDVGDCAREELSYALQAVRSLSSAPASSAVEGEVVADLPLELDGVADAIAYGKGFWRSCSGCHETNEGVPLGPFSNVLKCNIGMGCFECGGVGAIWDTTDYDDMGRALTPASSATCELCGGTGMHGPEATPCPCGITPASPAVEAVAEKRRRMSWEEMDAAGIDYCPRCGDTEHVRRIGFPAVVIECEACTKAIADGSEPNGADRRPYSTPKAERCFLCLGTGVYDAGYHDPRECIECGGSGKLEPEALTPASSAVEGEAVALTYTNWRGETCVRSILPKRVWFGATKWHPEPQWLLTAFDIDKQAERDFALKDFGSATSPAVAWRTMDSAPKDGTPIVALRQWPNGNVYAHVYKYEGHPNYWHAKREGVCIRPEYQDDYLWTYLPASPAPQTEDRADG